MDFYKIISVLSGILLGVFLWSFGKLIWRLRWPKGHFINPDKY